MCKNNMTIDPASEEEQKLCLTDQVVEKYFLDPWAEEFSLMTAGYRDRLDPDDMNNPDAPFNSITVAILTEAKARTFQKKLSEGEVGHVHVGGEVRPHTQDFIKITARIYAAHGMKVHLRHEINTSPIWYSSFGTAYEEFQSGDNFTASHSAFFKGGWKPMDSMGKQLLEDEDAIVAEVKKIVKNRETIVLSPWKSNNLISHDFDVDDAYLNYQNTVLGKEQTQTIQNAGAAGFRCHICPIGGSMKATSERLLEKLGITTGENGVIQYYLGEEDSQFHKVGQVGDDNLGVDPGNSKIYRNLGAQERLLKGDADLVLIWDPDGDRMKVITAAPKSDAEMAKKIGLEVEELEGNGKCIVYFTPNQLYFMLSAFRIESLKASGDFDKHDWFIGASLPTTKSLDELADFEGLPCLRVLVGFKYIGELCEKIETQLGNPVSFTSLTGENISLGLKPRAIILCEESGGATMGGSELLCSKNSANKMIAMREKDGMQIGLMTIALAASLYNRKDDASLLKYYCELASKRNIKNLHYNRADIRLYDENKLGDELKTAKAEGEAKRDRIMDFFKDLAIKGQHQEMTMDQIKEAINSRRAENTVEIPAPIKSYFAIGNNLPSSAIVFEAEDYRFILRSSGTDAVLRYYMEGKDLDYIKSIQKSLIELEI